MSIWANQFEMRSRSYRNEGIKLTATEFRAEGRERGILEARILRGHCISIVIYLGEDRQNVHVKIITRCLPMSPRTGLAVGNRLVTPIILLVPAFNAGERTIY